MKDKDITGYRKDDEIVLRHLFEAWSDRDEKYAMRRILGVPAPLTDAEVWSVRSYRKSEANDLVGTNQKLALMAIERWSPPAVRSR